jgi:hypothetical protein
MKYERKKSASSYFAEERLSLGPQNLLILRESRETLDSVSESPARNKLTAPMTPVGSKAGNRIPE